METSIRDWKSHTPHGRFDIVSLRRDGGNDDLGARHLPCMEVRRLRTEGTVCRPTSPGGQEIVLVYADEFRKLIEQRSPARISDRLVGEPMEWLVGPTVAAFKRSADIAGPLDREHTARGRVEQGFLRHKLMGTVEEAECSICGRRLPTGFLVAAHIKPRSECSHRERLDAENVVFPVCLLGCDTLYERGLISVRSGGRFCISKVCGNRTLRSLLKTLTSRRCSAWTESKALYFEWHLNNRFQG